MKDKIFVSVVKAVEVINSTLSVKLPIEMQRDCPLYSRGALDSISLGSLINLVEQNIEGEFQQSIILATEKAMSAKNSPFLTIGTLSDYIAQLLEKKSSCSMQ